MPESIGDPVLLTYLVLTFVPGLAIGLALGLRGWLLAAAGPLLTYGLVGIAGSVLPDLGLRWTPAAFAVTAALVAAVVAAVRLVAVRLVARRRRPVDPGPPPVSWTPLHHAGIGLAVLVAAWIGVDVAAAATHGFTAVPQVWDSVFHSNAIRYIADTGQSDPAALRNLNNPTTSSFYYPNAYHVLAATTLMITGSPVPAVVDASTAVFPGLLALSMAALVRRSGGRPAFAAAAALLSCAFTSFPYDLLPWGTLLPFIVSLALLPAFLAVAVTMLRRTAPLPAGSTVALPVALGVGGIGLLALHPSGAVAAAVLGAALVVQLWVERGPAPADLRAVGLTVVAAVALGSPLLLASLGAAAGPAFDWPASMRPADAMGELFFLGHEQLYPQYWLVALAVIGLFRFTTLRPVAWFVGASVLFAGLFVLAASYENELVALLTRPWWNDKWRFAALWALAAVLLAAAGLVGVRDGLWAVLQKVVPPLRRTRERSRLALSTVVLALVTLVAVVLSNGLYEGRNETRLAQAFTDGPTVSSAEEQAFAELARIVPEGSMVMNDPYDGSALMWALDDVRPVFASPVITPQELPTMDPKRRILLESFNQLDTNPDVQRAVTDLGIRYVIICTGFIAPADAHVPGMQDLDRVESLDLVYQNEDARIYAIGELAPAERE